MDLAEAFVRLEGAFVLPACSLDSLAMEDTDLEALLDSLAGDIHGQGIRPDRVERTAVQWAEPHKSERRAGADIDWERRLRSMARWPKYLAAEAAAVVADAECKELEVLPGRRTVATSKPAVESAVR